MTVAIVLNKLTSWKTNTYFIRNLSKNVPHLNSKCSCFTVRVKVSYLKTIRHLFIHIKNTFYNQIFRIVVFTLYVSPDLKPEVHNLKNTTGLEQVIVVYYKSNL